MKTIDILIVVDALGALASKSLETNVYLIDTNKYLGSWDEGECELETVCADGQIISWRIEGVSQANDVNIEGFVGEIITKKICMPERQGIAGAYTWMGRVETQGDTGSYQYSVNVSIDGQTMTFDPFLVVKKPS